MSLLFLVPAMVACWVGVGWFAVLMYGLVATSLCYHGGVFETHQPVCRLVDTCYASGLLDLRCLRAARGKSPSSSQASTFNMFFEALSYRILYLKRFQGSYITRELPF
jgi:hypothetical protein